MQGTQISPSLNNILVNYLGIRIGIPVSSEKPRVDNNPSFKESNIRI